MKKQKMQKIEMLVTKDVAVVKKWKNIVLSFFFYHSIS